MYPGFLIYLITGNILETIKLSYSKVVSDNNIIAENNYQILRYKNASLNVKQDEEQNQTK